MRQLCCLFLLTSALHAAEQVMLTWEGEVRGGATLFVHGNQVDMEGRETGSITSPKFQFVEPLPATANRVSVQVKTGGGRVSISEQPTRANDFTAIVDLRNNGAQPVFYRLEFYWEGTEIPRARGRGRRRVAEAGGTVTWTGKIDQDAIVEFRNRRAFTTVVRGRSLGNDDRAKFTSPIPKSGAAVELTQREGRGQVELLEQPSRDNGFAVKVRITDPASGEGEYSLTLSWNGGLSENRDSGGGILTPGGAGNATNRDRIRWTGRVDGVIRLSFEGNRVYPQRLEGAALTDDQTTFGRSLPRSAVEVSVNRIRGRGDIRVIQQPSRDNGYRLVLDVEDTPGGADLYEFDLSW